MFKPEKRDKCVVGAKEVKNAIAAGRAAKVYVASDCEPRVTAPVTEACERNNIELFYLATRKELGSMFGLKVAASCAAELL